MSSQYAESHQLLEGRREDMRPYTYKLLAEGQIRVLSLQPGAFGSPLVATLEHVSLDDAEGSYDAISYVWGPADFPHQLQVRDLGVLKLTESLHSALQHFRRESTTRKLWADAVCINQQDLVERSSQVVMMGSIYRSAKGVSIWLGPSQPSDALAFATLSASYPEEYWGEVQSKILDDLDRGLRSKMRCSCCDQSFPTTADLVFSGLLSVAHLLERQWFSRLWVVQEVPHDHKTVMHSGRHVAKWTNFEPCLYLLRSLSRKDRNRLLNADIAAQDFSRLMSREDSFRQTFGIGLRPTIFNAVMSLERIVECGSRHGFDPRDRIFSMYDVLQLSQLEGTVLDYSLSTANVYRRFMILAMEHDWLHGDKNVLSTFLSLVGTASLAQGDLNWPSWIPHFHYLTDRSREKVRYPERPHRSRMMWRGRESTQNWAVNLHDDFQLTVRGRIFAEVGCVLHGSQWPTVSRQSANGLTAEDIPRLLAWYSRCSGFVQHVGDSRGPDLDVNLLSTVASTYRILTCGWRMPYNWLFEGKEQLELVHTHFSELIEQFHQDPDSDPDGSIPIMASEQLVKWYIADDTETLDRHRYLCSFTGRNGHPVGGVRALQRLGDVFFALSGSPFPFLLRKREDGFFTLLGEAFVWNTTLKQALGGKEVAYAEGDGIQPWCDTDSPDMSWASGDPEMQQLFKKLDWITLR